MPLEPSSTGLSNLTSSGIKKQIGLSCMCNTMHYVCYYATPVMKTMKEITSLKVGQYTKRSNMSKPSKLKTNWNRLSRN